MVGSEVCRTNTGPRRFDQLLVFSPLYVSPFRVGISGKVKSFRNLLFMNKRETSHMAKLPVCLYFKSIITGIFKKSNCSYDI